jgi:DNA-binding FadR family transcriptional regulator
MSVSSVSSNSSLTQTDWRSLMKQWTQDFKQLSSALQDGDLAGAQKAFKALQQLQQSTQPGSQSSNGQPASSGNNPIQNDFATLGQALSSGDLSGAQGAFSQLQTDMQAAGANGASGGVQSAHHGHHHHGHVSSASDSDSDSTTADQTASTSSAASQSASPGSTFSIYA